MDIEKLMKPRWKIIRLWPHSECKKFSVGDIIMINDVGNDDFTRLTVYRKDNCPLITSDKWKRIDLDNNDHCFRKLEWWEGRRVEEMPEYIVIVEGGKKGFVSKVTYWTGYNALTTNKRHHQAIDVSLGKENACDWLPATLEEYESFKNNNSK